MSISVRSNRPVSAGNFRASLSPGRDLPSPAQMLSKDTKDLQDQLWTLRKNYTRSSEKNSSLRDALKLCRKCLHERDRQLDIANRMINKLSLHREALEASNIMQNTISEDKNIIRKLEASVTKAYNNVPGSVRTQNQEISQLTERVQTAEATAHAANAVVDKYEREVFMLRAALDIHAHEFQDGSGETVHASLVLALGQAREENGQLGGQLAEAKIRVARAEGAVDKLRAEQAWLLDQKRAAETGILHLQTSGVDLSSRLDMLQKDHQKALDDLASARDRVKDFENREANSLSESQRLQQKVVELQHALETASSTADTRSRSTAAQMQLQVESLTADHQSVQNSLKSQVLSLQQHIDSTTQQLQLAHSKLEEEKQSRAADTEHFGAELRKQQGHIVAAEDKAESKSKVVKGQEHELQDLHHQIDDLTGINQQLQLELQEAVATVERLKQELYNSVQRMAAKDHETAQVVKVAENATATLQKEYGLVMNENNTLKEDLRRLQTDLSSAMDRTDALIKERQNRHRCTQPEINNEAFRPQPEQAPSPQVSPIIGWPAREQEVSTLDSRAHVLHAQWIPSNHAVDIDPPQPLIAAHRHAYNDAQHTSAQERSRDSPAAPGTQSVSRFETEQRSRSGNRGSSLTAADLETESGVTGSAVQQLGHDVVEASAHVSSATFSGTAPGHLGTSHEVEQPPNNCLGAVERLARKNSRLQPPVSGTSFDNASPCLSTGISPNVRSTFLPLSTSPLTAQEDMGSSAGACHAPHSDKLAASQHHHQQAGTGLFRGPSNPGAASGQNSNSGRKASGDLSCWEKRLQNAQEKLQLMRLEREQWYAMASAADSAKKASHKGENAQTPQQPLISDMAGPGNLGGSMSAPLHYNGTWEPVNSRSSANSMAGAASHRHRKLQQPPEYCRPEVASSKAGDAMGCRQLVPHAPREYTSMPQPGGCPTKHVHTSASSGNHTCDNDRKDRCSRTSVDPVCNSGQPWTEPPHSHQTAAHGTGIDQQQEPFPSTSAEVLQTFQTPRLVSASGQNTTGVRKGDSGLTQQSHATWVADSIRQSVTGALDQAMEALEAELARKLPGRLQSDKRASWSSEGDTSKGALEPTGFQGPTESVRYRIDDIARMHVNEFGSGCGDL